jgi:glycosyltransferase involved in cell wall biosynthesis
MAECKQSGQKRQSLTQAKRRGGLGQRAYVVYWNNIPSPYMVERFNAVADLDNLEFEAWFNGRIESDCSWEVVESQWRFRYRYLPTTRLLGQTQRWPVPVLGRRADVIISLYAEPVFVGGWLLAKLRGCRTAFWCQVTMDRWVKRNWFKNGVKRLMFPHVDATLGHGEQSRRFAMQYGVPPSRALTLPHAIDVKHFREGSAAARDRREAFRRKHGLRGVTFLFVGRLWWGKGIIYFLEAFASVQRSVEQEVSVLLVGDGPEEPNLKRFVEEKSIRNVTFAGFKQKKDIVLFYAGSDVFVFPTLGDPYGLVVDEAMACSLPVISTTAAGEIRERIENGYNGFLCPPEDTAALTRAMVELVQDASLRRRMGERSFVRIRGQTPEKWANDFERVVETILGKSD